MFDPRVLLLLGLARLQTITVTLAAGTSATQTFVPSDPRDYAVLYQVRGRNIEVGVPTWSVRSPQHVEPYSDYWHGSEIPVWVRAERASQEASASWAVANNQTSEIRVTAYYLLVPRDRYQEVEALFARQGGAV